MKFENLKVLLNAYCLNYPILKHLGYAIPKPIILVVDDWDNVKSLLEKNFFKPIICTPQSGAPAMKKIVLQSNSRGIFLLQTKADSQKEHEKLDILNGIAMYGTVDDTEVSAATFVVTDSTFNCGDGQLVLEFFKNSGSNVVIDYAKLIPNEKQLGGLISEIEKIVDEERIAYPFLPITCFIRPGLYNLGLQNMYEEIRDYAKCISVLSCEESTEEKIEGIIDCIIHYAEIGGFSECYELPNLETEALERLDTACYVKGGILYVSERKFEDMCEAIKDSLGIIGVKRLMKKGGLLKCYQTGFTKKMSYFSPYGVMMRTCMLAICMDKISDGQGNPLSYFLN